MIANDVIGEVTGTRDLRLLGLLSETGTSYRSGGSCLTATKMALEDVNSNGKILKDYNLTYRWIDSKCDPGTALYRMFERISDDAPYLMLLGAACSVATEATAQVSHMWKLTQLSYESSSPVLSDRARFPRFFRLYPPDQKLNVARIALMKQFNWNKVATINEAREYFSAVIDDFVQRVKDSDVTIISQEIFVHDPYARVLNLKRHDARIIITAMYEDKAREVICAAFKIGLYGPKFVWMFAGWYSKTFWKVDLEKVDCTEDEMTQVVEGSFLTGAVVKNPVEEKGIANMTATEFEKVYLNHPTYSSEWASTDTVAPLCYDHIWVAALALECASQSLQETGHHKSLDEFTYSDTVISNTIFTCTGGTDFTGVSGRISFKTGSDPERIMNIERVQDGQRENIGIYRQDLENRHFEWREGGLRWKNEILRDSSYNVYVLKEIPPSLYILMTSLASFGICLALAFFAFNIMYSNNRYVKLSSPNINNMVLLGCVLCYCTVFFKTTETENDSVCKARIYCFSLGFTITFGAMFSKTWRVYRIFTNKKLIRRQIKDRQLFAVNCLLVAIILAVLIVLELLEPETVEIKFLEKEVYVTADGVEVHPYVHVCQSAYSMYFSWALRIIQGSLLVFGAFFAWETRNVRLAALNDSQKIGLCLYNVVVLSAVGVILTLLLEDQEVLLYGITSGFLIFGTTVTQMVIFVPKIHAVVNKVEVQTISTIAQNGTQTYPSISHH